MVAERGGGFSAHTEKGDGPGNLDHFSGSTRILVEPIGLQHASWNVLPLISTLNYCDFPFYVRVLKATTC